MVLDVSHLNDECFDEVVAHATRPFVASHSNSRAVCGVKRNLTDDQFRTIRDMGGIVGLNYCSEFLSNDATDKTAADVTFDQLAKYDIEHWLDLGGEDVIALGGDWDRATVPAFLSDASKMPEFQNMLSKHFGKTVMQKLCSDNALAFFELLLISHPLSGPACRTVDMPARPQSEGPLLTQQFTLFLPQPDGTPIPVVVTKSASKTSTCASHRAARSTPAHRSAPAASVSKRL